MIRLVLVSALLRCFVSEASDLNVISKLGGLSGSRSGVKVNNSTTAPLSGDTTVGSLYSFSFKNVSSWFFPSMYPTGILEFVIWLWVVTGTVQLTIILQNMAGSTSEYY